MSIKSLNSNVFLRQVHEISRENLVYFFEAVKSVDVEYRNAISECGLSPIELCFTTKRVWKTLLEHEEHFPIMEEAKLKTLSAKIQRIVCHIFILKNEIEHVQMVAPFLHVNETFYGYLRLALTKGYLHLIPVLCGDLEPADYAKLVRDKEFVPEVKEPLYKIIEKKMQSEPGKDWCGILQAVKEIDMEMLQHLLITFPIDDFLQIEMLEIMPEAIKPFFNAFLKVASLPDRYRLFCRAVKLNRFTATETIFYTLGNEARLELAEVIKKEQDLRALHHITDYWPELSNEIIAFLQNSMDLDPFTDWCGLGYAIKEKDWPKFCWIFQKFRVPPEMIYEALEIAIEEAPEFCQLLIFANPFNELVLQAGAMEDAATLCYLLHHCQEREILIRTALQTLKENTSPKNEDWSNFLCCVQQKRVNALKELMKEVMPSEELIYFAFGVVLSETKQTECFHLLVPYIDLEKFVDFCIGYKDQLLLSHFLSCKNLRKASLPKIWAFCEEEPEERKELFQVLRSFYVPDNEPIQKLNLLSPEQCVKPWSFAPV
jgi:hypothetical protein